MVVKGLQTSRDEEAQQLAKQIASRRIVNCCKIFHASGGHIYEKYSALSPDAAGGGGEYEVQLGFGWTNGVLLDFMDMYPDTAFRQNI